MADQPQITTTPQGDTQATAAQAIVKSIASAPPVQPEPQVSARAKELAVPSTEVSAQEVTTGAQAIEQEPIPPEVEAWMEKVGTAHEPSAVSNLPKVQLPEPSAPKLPTSSLPAFVLPLGENEMKVGMNASVNDSIRWLATWCQKIIKQLKGQAVFKQT